MVRKRKKQEEEEKPWCFYCDREFGDETDLILHQKNKHFKCSVCNKRLATAKALTVHSLQVHKVAVARIPDAKDGRDDTSWEIFGSSGIPAGMKRGEKPPTQDQQHDTAGAGPHQMGPPLLVGYGGPIPYGAPPPFMRPGQPGPFYPPPMGTGPHPPPFLGRPPFPGPPPFGLPRPGFGPPPPRPPHPYMQPHGPMPPHARPGYMMAPPPSYTLPPQSMYSTGPPQPVISGALPGAPPNSSSHANAGVEQSIGRGGEVQEPAAPGRAAGSEGQPSAAFGGGPVGGEGIYLVWNDEDFSMEERRASLPRYAQSAVTQQ